jgi:type I restriction-modification system DNA methylase subunit
MAAPKVIADLVERFADNQDVYRRDYGETEARREFIDPLFRALGWDIDNTAGHAEAYKDVVHEDSVKVGGSTKAPDYSFRVGGSRKFFLEAKKPAVRVGEDAHAAYQLRRYGWSAKLPLSILCNFEQFAVYDCRTQPSLNDKANAARLMLVSYKDYISRWDDIAAIFSKEALYKGSFDKYAAGTSRRGTTEVDDAFLEEIESWRDALARNIAERNTKLSTAELNFAVQQTIDRVIFLRICEDRGIEHYGRLHQLLNGENVYARLKEIFHDADERYNSGLFHFRSEKSRRAPDSLSLALKIDDKVLRDILRHLYLPDSPYEFSVLPADILGQVYEQFLGKVIRLTTDGHAKVEEKPEVKKAGGVYYTPTYIVEYIVRETVEKLLQGSTPDKVSKLRLLDPACGSGSFLIVAYQHILDWHRIWYSSHKPEKWAKGKTPRIYKGPGGAWRLTTGERKRILLNNIYGVDKDPQAVEVTKLSLLLKLLEGASDETLQGLYFRERLLPDLDSNIKCGNSVISTDFAVGRLDFGDRDEVALNPFDWNSEYASILSSGGFDAIIGNPPYVRPHNISPEEKEYFWKHYNTFTHKSDLYCCFIERSLALLKKGGRFSFIVSHGWLRLNSFQELRKLFLQRTAVSQLVELPFQVFKKATVTTGIFVVTKGQATAKHAIQVRTAIRTIDAATFRDVRQIPQATFQSTFQNVFDISISPETEAIKNRMRKGDHVGDYFDIRFGLKSGDDEEFLHSERGLHEEDKPLLRGDDVKRYSYKYKGEYVWYVPDRMRRHRKTARPGEAKRFEQPKILVKDTSADFGCTYDEDRYYVKDVLIVTPRPAKKNRIDLRALVGILNSKLMYFYYRTTFPTLHVQNEELASLPLPRRSASNENKLLQLSGLVEEMLACHRGLAAARTPHARTSVERKIAALDIQIDGLVNEVYGVTKGELKAIESATVAEDTSE